MSDEEKKEKGGGGGNTLLLILIILLFIIVMALGGLVVYLLLSKGDHEASSAEGEKAAVTASAEHGAGDEEEHGDEENPHAKQYSPKYKQFPPPPADAPPQYFEMKKLVVNFKGEGKARFLAVDLKFMTYYPQVVTEMEHLRPILLNDIIQHLRIQTYSKLNKDDGPDVLRKELLEIARHVLDKHGIYPDLLEDVYLERFVMQ